MWAPTSSRVERISSPEKFRSSAEKDFFNTICQADFPQITRRLIFALQLSLEPSAWHGRNGSLRYLFEDFALDTDRRELRRGADVLSTTPKVFDLLEYLIRHRERVVSKDDLISTVWKGRAPTSGLQPKHAKSFTRRLTEGTCRRFNCKHNSNLLSSCHHGEMAGYGPNLQPTQLCRLSTATFRTLRLKRLLTIHLSTPLTHTNSRIRALAAQQEYAFRRLMPSRCQKTGRLA
jgi:Transcriptional regulatory protein, C terminal